MAELKTNLTQSQLDQLSKIVTFTMDGAGVLCIKDVHGDVTGSVFGSVFGDVEGNVGGDVNNYYAEEGSNDD
jgi:hypothetical protein